MPIFAALIVASVLMSLIVSILNQNHLEGVVLKIIIKSRVVNKNSELDLFYITRELIYCLD
jgi:Na+/proline symporter